MYKYFLTLLLFFSCALANAKPVLVMSLSKMTPYRTDMGGNFQALRETVSVAPKIYWNHPSLIIRTPYIIQKAFTIAPVINGMDNLVHHLSQELEQKKWAQLNQQEKDAIIQIIVAPIRPDFDVINKMKAIIEQGFNFILATNQAIAQHTAYKDVMKQKYQLAVNELCTAGTVTAPTYHDSRYNRENSYTEIEPNWLVACDINPSESYCKALRELADRQEKNSPIYMVHTFKTELAPETAAMFQKYDITLFNSIDELKQAI